MNNFLSYIVTPYLSKTFVSCLSAVTVTLICLHIKKKKYLSTKVIFYEPSKNLYCKTCHHDFSVNCSDINCTSHKTKNIAHCIQNARKSIDICVFAISNEPITTAIINAYQRGIHIRIIISNCVLSHSKEIKQLQKLGINVKFQGDSENSYMHNKFSIVDSKWLIHGSMNWTHQATHSNWENVFITNLESLVVEFSKGFEKIWLNIQ